MLHFPFLSTFDVLFLSIQHALTIVAKILQIIVRRPHDEEILFLFSFFFLERNSKNVICSFFHLPLVRPDRVFESSAR